MTTKKALIVLGSLIGLTALTLIIPAQYVGVKTTKRPSLVLKTGEELALLQGDKDGNNIPDWKDLLNENMSTTTKEAVAKLVVDDETKARLNDPNNLTASFSKNIYMASAYAKEKGTLTPRQQEEIANDILTAEGAKMTFKTYEVTDLRLSKSETQASKKAYINSLGTIYTKTSATKINVDDITTMNAFNVRKDPAMIESLVVKKNLLENIIKELLSATIPYSAVPYHLMLINSISKYKSIVENLAQINEDPIRATLAFNAYQSTLQDLYSSFISLQTYLALENVTLSKSDPGYVLISGSTKK